MMILNKISKTISNTNQKAHNAADMTNLNNKIAENNRQIQQLYAEIGEAYCNMHSDDAEDYVSENVKYVRELKTNNEELNDQIQALNGFIKCPNCGEYVPSNSPYCTSCGHRLLSDDKVICPSCGQVLEKGMPFCQYCGARLPEQSQA